MPGQLFQAQASPKLRPSEKGGHSWPGRLPEWCPQAHWGPGHRRLSIPHPPSSAQLSTSPTYPLGTPVPAPTPPSHHILCLREDSVLLFPPGPQPPGRSTHCCLRGLCPGSSCPARGRGKSPEPKPWENRAGQGASQGQSPRLQSRAGVRLERAPGPGPTRIHPAPPPAHTALQRGDPRPLR